MMDWSWTELQALGVKAASGAQVPPAQALAFGAMLARHLADEGDEAPVLRALEAPDTIVALAHAVERLVEAASISPAGTASTREGDAGRRALLVSWLNGLPCRSEVSVAGDTVRAMLSLVEPSTRARPVRIAVSQRLADALHDLAARTYVPDSAASRAGGAGAGLMELD
ncbi:hypothetical protein [uncultured Tateyamaria sp.]|uniref:hypothetical protein n=1 Tax=uncultured Tateyamaria sp. TaxID=455651 RepID=UPI0026054625|nr:hypothetical protein [uncultured Tateyamaria sp.]